MRNWLPIVGWFLCTYLLWIASPEDKANKRAIIYAHFHAIISAWFCLLFVLFNHNRLYRNPLQAFPVMLSGFFSLAVGFSLVAFIVHTPSTHFMLANFIWLWEFYCIYFMMLTLLLVLLGSLYASKAAPLLACMGLLTQGNLYLSEVLLLFPLESRATATTIFLYCNPSLVACCCFPRYDYLRSSIFYAHSPLGTDIVSFRYPDAKIACISYFILAMFFLTMWCFYFLKRKKYARIH